MGRARSRRGALLLGAAAWIVGLGWLDAPYWVLVAWGAVLAVCAAAAWLASSASARLSAGGVAGSLEDLGAWRRGALTALLDRSAAGTSAALLDLADRSQADDVVRRGVTAAEPLARPIRVLGLAGLGALVVGLAAFGSAGPVHGPAAALWHPRRAWDATVAPVRIRAEREVVDRGDSTAPRARGVRPPACDPVAPHARAKVGGRPVSCSTPAADAG